MFKTVIVGPIATRPFGLARTCIECDVRPQGNRPCRGFGPSPISESARTPVQGSKLTWPLPPIKRADITLVESSGRAKKS